MPNAATQLYQPLLKAIMKSHRSSPPPSYHTLPLRENLSKGSTAKPANAPPPYTPNSNTAGKQTKPARANSVELNARANLRGEASVSDKKSGQAKALHTADAIISTTEVDKKEALEVLRMLKREVEKAVAALPPAPSAVSTLKGKGKNALHLMSSAQEHEYRKNREDARKFKAIEEASSYNFHALSTLKRKIESGRIGSKDHIHVAYEDGKPVGITLMGRPTEEEPGYTGLKPYTAQPDVVLKYSVALEERSEIRSEFLERAHEAYPKSHKRSNQMRVAFSHEPFELEAFLKVGLQKKESTLLYFEGPGHTLLERPKASYAYYYPMGSEKEAERDAREQREDAKKFRVVKPDRY